MADIDEPEAELPLDNAGARLVRARDAAGLSRAQVAAATRIPERHLAAIEQANYGALPARTYAIGFARSYAKAVGIDAAAIVATVREELAAQEPDPRRPVATFEPGDPARVPGARVAWLAALAALVVILAGFALWRSYYAPGGELPSIIADETAAPAPRAAPASAAPAPAPTAGAVVFTAQAPGVWVKFYDGAGTQLLQKELVQGESYQVPEGMNDVRLWTARPDALAITIGGQPVPRLSETQRTMKDVPVTAAALLARAPAATAGSASAPVPVPAQAQPARVVRRAAPPSAPPAAAASGGSAPVAAAAETAAPATPAT